MFKKVSDAIVEREVEKEAHRLVVELLRGMDKVAAMYKDNVSGFGTILAFVVLKKMVSIMTHGILTSSVKEAENSSMSKKEVEKWGQKAYLTMRGGIEDAISYGFSDGMRMFSGRTIEYYSEIRAVPEVANKKPC